MIWIIDRDGSHRRALTATGSPIGAHGSPAWSPDGRRIAFVTSAAGEPQLWTVTADGGEPARVGRVDHVFDPVFSPDGHTIYAATGGESIFAIPVSPETGQPTAVRCGFWRPGRVARHLSISRDGRHLAMTGLGLGSHIWTMPMAGERTTGPPAAVTVERVPRQTRPAFSPSGAELAFWTRRPGAGSEVWTVNPAGGASSPIISSDLANPIFYAGATWVATGRSWCSACTARRRCAWPGWIWIRAARRRYESQVPTQAGRMIRTRRVLNADDLAVSPDGTSAAYSRIDESERTAAPLRAPVRGTDAHAGDERRVARTISVWSPDGRTLAFELKKDDATNVAVVPAAGGSPRLVTAERNESWPLAGRPTATDRVRGLARRIVESVVGVPETGTSQQLTTYTSANTFVRYPAWSPRGDRIAYELGTVTGNIWIGWLPDSRRLGG